MTRTRIISNMQRDTLAVVCPQHGVVGEPTIMSQFRNIVRLAWDIDPAR